MPKPNVTYLVEHTKEHIKQIERGEASCSLYPYSIFIDDEDLEKIKTICTRYHKI